MGSDWVGYGSKRGSEGEDHGIGERSSQEGGGGGDGDGDADLVRKRLKRAELLHQLSVVVGIPISNTTG